MHVIPLGDRGSGPSWDSQSRGLPSLTTGLSSSLNLPETSVSERVFACSIIIAIKIVMLGLFTFYACCLLLDTHVSEQLSAGWLAYTPPSLPPSLLRTAGCRERAQKEPGTSGGGGALSAAITNKPHSLMVVRKKTVLPETERGLCSSVSLQALQAQHDATVTRLQEDLQSERCRHAETLDLRVREKEKEKQLEVRDRSLNYLEDFRLRSFHILLFAQIINSGRLLDLLEPVDEVWVQSLKG